MSSSHLEPRDASAFCMFLPWPASSGGLHGGWRAVNAEEGERRRLTGTGKSLKTSLLQTIAACCKLFELWRMISEKCLEGTPSQTYCPDCGVPSARVAQIESFTASAPNAYLASSFSNICASSRLDSGSPHSTASAQGCAAPTSAATSSWPSRFLSSG